jgi:hypothetical protein
VEHRKNGKEFPVLNTHHQRFVLQAVAMAAVGNVATKTKFPPHNKKAGEAGLFSIPFWISAKLSTSR